MKRKLITFLSILAIALGGLMTSSCDDVDPASEDITITPSESTLKIGESVDLTAAGGYSYTWSLANEDRGALSTRTGSTTTYTSHYEPEEDIYSQVVTVTSTIAPDYDDSSSSSNSTGSTGTGEAYVKHISSVVTVSPISGTVSAVGDKVTFTASGGSSFSWTLDATGSTAGSITPTTGATVVFTYENAVTTSATAKLTVVNENNQTYTVDIYLVIPPGTP